MGRRPARGPVEVIWSHTDGTTRVDRFDAPVVSAQTWDGGRALVLLADRQGRITGTVHYAAASRIATGTAVHKRRKGRR